MKPSNVKYLYIEGIRAIAAVYVMMTHMTLGVNLQQSWFNNLIVSIFRYGHYAVDVFIVISGYCLMLPVLKNGYNLPSGVFDFYKRRFIRIYPTYFICGLVCLLLISFLIGDKTGTVWDLSHPVNKWDILTHLLLIQDFFYSTSYKINYIFWSISVESRIYIVFPLLLWCCRKWSVLVTLILSFFISFSLWLILMFSHRYFTEINVSYSGVHPYIILFSSGMFAAYLSFGVSSIKIKIPWVLILVIFILIQFVLEAVNKGTSIKDINIGFCTLCFITSIEKSRDSSFNLRWIERFLSKKFIVFIGAYAYSIYLFHPPLVQLLYKLVSAFGFGSSTAYYLLLIGGTPLILTICYGLFVVFEKPFFKYRLKKKTSVIESNNPMEPAP